MQNSYEVEVLSLQITWKQVVIKNLISLCLNNQDAFVCRKQRDK